MALAFFDQSAGVGELLKGLEDSDEFRRWEAVYSLKKIAGPQGLRVLVDHLDQQNEPVVRVRQQVALALGSNGDGELVDELIKALSTDTSAQVRWRAALSIGKLGDSSVVGELERLLTMEQESQVREYITRAIMQLDKR